MTKFSTNHEALWGLQGREVYPLLSSLSLYNLKPWQNRTLGLPPFLVEKIIRPGPSKGGEDFFSKKIRGGDFSFEK